MSQRIVKELVRRFKCIKKSKVVYTNVVSKDLIAENFNATGIDVNVTFNKRPSDATVHEVRRVFKPNKCNI